MTENYQEKSGRTCLRCDRAESATRSPSFAKEVAAEATQNFRVSDILEFLGRNLRRFLSSQQGMGALEHSLPSVSALNLRTALKD
ncbi:hypothetical protein EPN83_01715 [Patescibacteria group bacterium]|nr:MAG: hypothetical protein EPN83_01715 [Patescibacteria group bacterium]